MMKCKHIPDERVIRAIKETRGLMGVGVIEDNWRNRDLVWASLDRAMSFHVPEKLFLAKISKLSDRGLIDACCTHSRRTCGMKIHLAEECRNNTRGTGMCGA